MSPRPSSPSAPVCLTPTLDQALTAGHGLCGAYGGVWLVAFNGRPSPFARYGLLRPAPTERMPAGWAMVVPVLS